MKQPPQADPTGQNHQPEDLVAPERPRLPLARLSLGDLLLIRLDAGLNHGRPNGKVPTNGLARELPDEATQYNVQEVGCSALSRHTVAEKLV